MSSIFERLSSNSIARSTFALMGTRVLSILIGVALSVLLARWLAPEGYGTYLFTLTIAQFLAMPILAGLPTLVVREVAIARGNNDPRRLAGILRWSAGFILLTFSTVAILGTILLFLQDHSGSSILIYYMALPLVLALAFLNLVCAILQGYEHPVAGNLGDGLLRPTLLLTLVSVAAMTGFLNPLMALWSHVAATCIAGVFALGYWILVCCGLQQSQRAQPRYENRRWLLSLLPLGLITAASLLNSRLDILMLGILSASDDVARYGIAAQVAGLVVMGQTIVNSIVAPKIARLYQQADHTELHRMITHAARLSTTIALAVFLFIFLLGAQIIEGLLGQQYAASWLIALILCGGNLVSSAMGPVAKVLTMTGYERAVARLVWLSALVNAIFNLLLVPICGAVGAAIATAIAQIVCQTLMVYWSATRLRINTTVLGRPAAPN